MGALSRLPCPSISYIDRTQKVIGSVCVARDRSEIKRTLDDLATINQRLRHEVAERKQMEIALQETNTVSRRWWPRWRSATAP